MVGDCIVVLFTVSLVGCATESGYYDPGQVRRGRRLGRGGHGRGSSALSSARPPATPPPAPGWARPPGASWVAWAAALYAAHRNSEIRSAQAAAQANNYQGQGTVVNVDNVMASPTVARPGQPIKLGMTYTILTPANTPVSVTLVREVRYQGQMVGSPYQTTVSNSQRHLTRIA